MHEQQIVELRNVDSDGNLAVYTLGDVTYEPHSCQPSLALEYHPSTQSHDYYYYYVLCSYITIVSDKESIKESDVSFVIRRL